MRAFWNRLAPLQEAGPRLPRPEDSAGPEQYAFALMQAGVEAAAARELVRAAIRRHERERASYGRDVRYRDREAEAREAEREGARAASRRLLAEVGCPVEDDGTPSPPSAPTWQQLWAPYSGGSSQDGSLDYQPNGGTA